MDDRRGFLKKLAAALAVAPFVPGMLGDAVKDAVIAAPEPFIVTDHPKRNLAFIAQQIALGLAATWPGLPLLPATDMIGKNGVTDQLQLHWTTEHAQDLAAQVHSLAEGLTFRSIVRLAQWQENDLPGTMEWAYCTGRHVSVRAIQMFDAQRDRMLIRCDVLGARA